MYALVNLLLCMCGIHRVEVQINLVIVLLAGSQPVYLPCQGRKKSALSRVSRVGVHHEICFTRRCSCRIKLVICIKGSCHIENRQ